MSNQTCWKKALAHALDAGPIQAWAGRHVTGMVHQPVLGDLVLEWTPYEWGRTTALGIRQLPADESIARHFHRRRFVGVPKYEAPLFVEWLWNALSEIERHPF